MGKFSTNSRNSVRLPRITESDLSVEAASSQPRLEDPPCGATMGVACRKRRRITLDCCRGRGRVEAGGLP